MNRLPLAPTKSNLILVKHQLALARDGYDLLEQKREILVMALMDMLDEVKILEKDLETSLSSAYPALREMLFKIGRDNALRLGQDIQYNFGIIELNRQIAGINFQILETSLPEFELKYSFKDSRADCDKTSLEFFGLLGLLARLASIRAVVLRLARELKKTQRRVNALEKMVIPQNQATRRYIENVLEEQERESFFARKRLKARGERP